MAATPRKTFRQALFAPTTMIPIVLGVVGGAVLALMSAKQRGLGAFVAIAGVLGGLGVLMTQLMGGGRKLNATLTRKRQELRTQLGELADDSRFTPSAEADQHATPATAERL
jgi:hypothetical protein